MWTSRASLWTSVRKTWQPVRPAARCLVEAICDGHSLKLVLCLVQHLLKIYRHFR